MTIESPHARTGIFYQQTDALEHAPLRQDTNAQGVQLTDLIFVRRSARTVRTSITLIAIKLELDASLIAKSVMDINVLEVCQTSQILSCPLVEMASW